MKRLISRCCLILLLLGVTSAFAQEDPVIISVEDISYTLSKVQSYLDNYISSYQAEENYELTADDKERLKNSVFQSFVDMAVIKIKCTDLGILPLSQSDVEALNVKAQSMYEQLVETYAKQVEEYYQTTAEMARNNAVSMMEMQGVSVNSLYEQFANQHENELLLAHLAGDITSVSDEAIESSYRQYYVEPCQQAYAYDISAYEQDTVLSGASSYYTPEGYRRIRQILIPYAADLQSRMMQSLVELETAFTACNKAQEALESATTAQMDTTELQSAYDEACLIYYEKQNTYEALKNSGMTENQMLLSDIQAKIDDDVPFAELVREYSPEQTEELNVHRNSVLFSTELINAVFALDKPLDISAPVADGLGIHILCYVADLPFGEVAMTDAIRTEINNSLVLAERYKVLEALLPQWRTEYNIVSDDSLLSVK